MKAIRYYGPKDLRFEHIPEPVVGPGQVKIKVEYSVQYLKRMISDCLVRHSVSRKSFDIISVTLNFMANAGVEVSDILLRRAVRIYLTPALSMWKRSSHV